MKTAISIPDKLFKEAEREAKRLGISRSKLYQSALENMIRAKRGAAFTERINKTIAEHGDPSDGEEAWLEMGEDTVREHSEWNVRSKKNETGELWWASLGEPSGSEAGFRRPVLIVSANELNVSNLRTVITVPVTGNLSREHYEMNVRLPARGTGLSSPSVVQTSIISATNKRLLTERIGRVPDELMTRIDACLKLVLDL